MEPSRRPRWKRKRWIAAGLAWLALGYPLGLGPAVWLYDRSLIPSAAVPFVEAFYAPLTWLDELGGPAADVLHWYVGLWEGG